MHDAGAALAGVATDMRAGEGEFLAEQMNQKRAWLTSADAAFPFTVIDTVGIVNVSLRQPPPQDAAVARLRSTRRRTFACAEGAPVSRELVSS